MDVEITEGELAGERLHTSVCVSVPQSFRLLEFQLYSEKKIGNRRWFVSSMELPVCHRPVPRGRDIQRLQVIREGTDSGRSQRCWPSQDAAVCWFVSRLGSVMWILRLHFGLNYCLHTRFNVCWRWKLQHRLGRLDILFIYRPEKHPINPEKLQANCV